jgi:hypothetical protein
MAGTIGRVKKRTSARKARLPERQSQTGCSQLGRIRVNYDGGGFLS